MLIHPQFSPIAVKIGPLAVHWYGLTYLVAFVLFLLLANLQTRREPFASRGWSGRDVEDLLFFGVLGVVLGGRLGYVLFYKPGYYLAHPLDIPAVWQGGMSFHGGLLGVSLAMIIFARLRRRRVFDVSDLVAPCVPLGLASGRIGNFINGELWGRFADPALPWGMVFPQSGSPLPRHPSQLYQFGLEGVTLFVILWWFGRKPRPLGQVTAAFLMGYGAFRFTAEYFREPDSFLGPLALGLSMGQWLCVPMVVSGALLWRWSARQARA
ncbi:prolipoprotein diacylglyceryl transferase [Aquabacterium sp.]|uniref:prolipoprotein diacylglyceryl transferase n=1 Tax=Aquabacterium sp. TaxID=1872578 RepID=UPI0035AE5BC0